MRSTLYIKPEITAGTDSNPTQINSISIKNQAIPKPLGDYKGREVVLPFHGSMPGENVILGIEIPVTAELKGSGEKGTPPRCGALLRACGFAETIIAGTSVEYNLVADPSAGETVTAYYYYEGMLFKMLGCVGSDIKFNMNNNEDATIETVLRGIYAGPVEAVLGAIEFETTKPLKFRDAEVSLNSIDNYSIATCNIDLPLEVNRRPDANINSNLRKYFIGKRGNPKVTVDPEITAATQLLGLWENSTEFPLGITLGATEGNIVEFSLPKLVANQAPEFGDRENRTIHNLSAEAYHTNGNDEISLLFR